MTYNCRCRSDMKSWLATIAFALLATGAYAQTTPLTDAEARAQTRKISAVRVILVGEFDHRGAKWMGGRLLCRPRDVLHRLPQSGARRTLQL
ncbi:hypothetical protein MMA231_03792 (plasmid) [Asticcacaulis sp. MM231]